MIGIRPETPRAKTFRLRPTAPVSHLAGQYSLVRLTAPDGYTASRAYSIASPPSEEMEFDITVERLEGGEVSEFLHDEVAIGDELEIRAPIGGWFVWGGDTPAVLVGGGSGVVPLMAMLRHARRLGRTDVRLVVSVRGPDDLYFAGELPGPETTVVYTRHAPPGEPRAPRRLELADIAPLILPGAAGYVCGSAGFAETATNLLLAAGMTVDRMRVERFGPTS